MEEYSNNLSTTLSTDHGHSGYDYEGYEYDYGYYDYNYTYTEAIDYLPLTQIVPVSLVYGLIGITGIIGNTLVIFAIAKVQRMRSITNLFLLSLASADLLLVVVCVPVKISLLLALLVPISAIINRFNSVVYEKPIQQAIFTHNIHATKKSARGRSIQQDENHDAPQQDAKLERLGLLDQEHTLSSLSKPHDNNSHGTGINNDDSASTKSHTSAFLLDNVDALNNFRISVSDTDANLKHLRRVRDTSALVKSKTNGSPQSATYDITHLSSMCPFADICDIQGREVQEKNTDSCCLPCSCTSTCGQIGNCCDKHQNIGNMCRYPVVQSWEFLQFIGGLGFKYFIVDKCLDGTNRDCKEMEAASWGPLDPVYDPVSQMNYYNPQCAKCNGVEKVTKWELTLVYRGIVKNENIRKALRGEVSKECMVKFTPPKIMNIKKNVCSTADLIDRCNVTGTWKNYDVALEEACLRWYAPVVAKKGPMLFAFENKYCELCNNGYFEPDEVCKAIKPGRFAYGPSNVFTIDYRQVPAIVDEQDDDWLMSVESDRCGQDMVKHISKHECRVVLCPIGFVKSRGTCRPLLKNVLNDLFYAQLLLTPSPDTLLPRSYIRDLTVSQRENPGSWFDAQGAPIEFFEMFSKGVTINNTEYVESLVVRVGRKKYPLNLNREIEAIRTAIETPWVITFKGEAFHFSVEFYRYTFDIFNEIKITKENVLNYLTLTGDSLSFEPSSPEEYYEDNLRNWEVMRPLLLKKTHFCNRVRLTRSEWIAGFQEIRLNTSGEIYDNDKRLGDSEFDIFLDETGEPTVEICVEDFNPDYQERRADDINKAPMLSRCGILITVVVLLGWGPHFNRLY